MHLGSDVDIYADVQILELRVDQRVDAHAADARLKRTGCDRHAVADLERCLLPIHRSNLRVLDKFGTAVTEQRRGRGGRNGYHKFGRVQVAQPVQVDLVGGSRSAAYAIVGLIVGDGIVGGEIVLQCDGGAGGRTDAQVPR